MPLNQFPIFRVYMLSDNARIRRMALTMQVEQKVIDDINKVLAKMGMIQPRTETEYYYWTAPKGVKSSIAFGYTPHKREHHGKIGFFAVKLRKLKNGDMKLLKAVRFGKRKIAKRRALQWYHKQFGKAPLGWENEL